jgi:hypothetical protein
MKLTIFDIFLTLDTKTVEKYNNNEPCILKVAHNLILVGIIVLYDVVQYKKGKLKCGGHCV